MSTDPPKHRDRYDVSGNVEAEYVDPDKSVLVNKLGLRSLADLHVAEELALASAYETMLAEVRVATRLTNTLILRVHGAIFGELYEWAGRWRTVTISKPGITWPPPRFVPEAMDEFERAVLSKHVPELLVSDELFCVAVAEIQGEFLVVHPFREGNARTIKLATDLLAVQTGRSFLSYDTSDAGREKYNLAAGQAFKRNYQPLMDVIRTALNAARRQS